MSLVQGTADAVDDRKCRRTWRKWHYVVIHEGLEKLQSDFKPAVYTRENFVDWRRHPVGKLVILTSFGPSTSLGAGP